MDWSKPTSWGMATLGMVAAVQTILVIVWNTGIEGAYLWTNYGFAIEIGLLVGSTEMISRYRDDPFAPLVSTPGAFYILINGGAAALAYFLMGALKVPLQEPMRTLAAGLGAMAFFRSGLFTVRMGNSDIAVGPNIVLQVVLQALDRAYDRQRAVPRSKAVSQIMGGVAFAQVREALPTLCFDLMQNVSDSEISAINSQINDLANSPTMGDDAKILSLGLALFNLVGEETLRAAITALGTNIAAFRQVGAQMLLDLAKIDPKVVVATLPDVCKQLPSAKDADQPGAFEAPVANPGLTPESLAVLTLYCLVAHYGDQRVSVALGILAAQANSVVLPVVKVDPAADPDVTGDQSDAGKADTTQTETQDAAGEALEDPAADPDVTGDQSDAGKADATNSETQDAAPQALENPAPAPEQPAGDGKDEG